MLTFSHFEKLNIPHGITEAGDAAPADLVMGQQIHKDIAKWVDSSDKAIIPKADALITRAAGVTLGVRTADCVPLLFADPGKKVVGTIHAGWRGTALEIARKAIEALRYPPHQVRVGIGPAICEQCFVVGDEVAAQFDDSVVDHSGAQTRVDLWQANVNQLLEAGVLEKHIEVMRVCTLESEQLHSFRGGEREQRNVAWIRVA